MAIFKIRPTNTAEEPEKSANGSILNYRNGLNWLTFMLAFTVKAKKYDGNTNNSQVRHVVLRQEMPGERIAMEQ